jgi:hypothetical protein
LVADTAPGGVAFRLLVFRRRDIHRAIAAIKARTTIPPTTPPAIGPVFTDELTTAGTDVVTYGLLVEDVRWDEERLEGTVEDEVEDGRTEDCDEARTQDTSTPLVTLKRLD